MFGRLSAAALAALLLLGLIPTAASAAPADRRDRSSEYFSGGHFRCMYRCEERFDERPARADTRRGWGWMRDRRRADRCRDGPCGRLYQNDGRCWYHDGDRWRRCRWRESWGDRWRERTPYRWSRWY